MVVLAIIGIGAIVAIESHCSVSNSRSGSAEPETRSACQAKDTWEGDPDREGEEAAGGIAALDRHRRGSGLIGQSLYRSYHCQKWGVMFRLSWRTVEAVVLDSGLHWR